MTVFADDPVGSTSAGVIVGLVSGLVPVLLGAMVMLWNTRTNNRRQERADAIAELRQVIELKGAQINELIEDRRKSDRAERRCQERLGAMERLNTRTVQWIRWVEPKLRAGGMDVEPFDPEDTGVHVPDQATDNPDKPEGD